MRKMRYKSKAHKCPDCGLILSRMSWLKRHACTNSECLVIFVEYYPGKPYDRIKRIVRVSKGIDVMCSNQLLGIIAEEISS